MKKLITIAAISVASLSATCAMATSKSSNNGYFNHWGISVDAITLNDNIPSQLNDFDMGYKLGLHYNYNKYLYSSVSVLVGKHESSELSSSVGVQGYVGRFMPYADLNINNINKFGDSLSGALGYDFGSSYVVNKFIIPFVELDDVTSKNKQAVCVGMHSSIMKNVSMKIQYSRYIQNNNDSLDIGMSYYF